MRLGVSATKRYFFVLVPIGIVLIGAAGVLAYVSTGVGGNPASFGHSVNEMDWDKTIQDNVSALGFCIGTNCITDWAQVGGTSGTSITNLNSVWQNGSNPSVTCLGSAPYSQVAGGLPPLNGPDSCASSEFAYYNEGNVGIGVTNPTANLEVQGTVKVTGAICIGQACFRGATKPLYVQAAGCGGGVTNSSTCKTNVCVNSCQSWEGVTTCAPMFYSCSGGCSIMYNCGSSCATTASTTCSNTFLGYFITAT